MPYPAVEELKVPGRQPELFATPSHSEEGIEESLQRLLFAAALPHQIQLVEQLSQNLNQEGYYEALQALGLYGLNQLSPFYQLEKTGKEFSEQLETTSPKVSSEIKELQTSFTETQTSYRLLESTFQTKEEAASRPFSETDRLQAAKLFLANLRYLDEKQRHLSLQN